MNKILLPLLYAGPSHYFTFFQQDNEIHLEKHENFVKSTFRNRAQIAGPNGSLLLSIPIKGGKGRRQKYSEVRIDNSQHWQKNHWQSLISCYRSSPYFEFYENDIHPFYHMKFELLFDFNIKLFELLLGLTGIKSIYLITSDYSKDLSGVDLRTEFRKRLPSLYKPYMQVFETKNGFIPSLSIFDLLFNLGPESMRYLTSINLEEFVGKHISSNFNNTDTKF